MLPSRMLRRINGISHARFMQNIHMNPRSSEVLAAINNPLECGNDQDDAECRDTVVCLELVHN